MLRAIVFLLAGLGAATAVKALPVYYTDWTSATGGLSGSASGTIAAPGYGSIGISYSGEVYSATQVTGGPTYYWTEGTPAPYTGNAVVGNTPADGDIITLRGQNSNPITQTITFSQPVTNPIMLILSLGQSPVPVDYDFNAPFNLLSAGVGFWGGGATSLTELPGDVLHGVEGHGAIQFTGTFTSISWTASPTEAWHGFTIGVTSVPDAASTFGLLLLGAFLLGVMKQFRWMAA